MLYGLYSSNVAPFDLEKDIPDLTDKVILITGTTSGVGLSLLRHLSAHAPRAIYLPVRPSSLGRLEKEISSILGTLPASKAPPKLQPLPCDLSSLASVRSCIETFLTQADRLDLLILNAGIMAVPAGLTADGYEVQFGVNYVSHALMTKLLMPMLLSTARRSQSASSTGTGPQIRDPASTATTDVRVITLSSVGHLLAPPTCGISFEALRTPMGRHPTLMRYGQSKLANVLFSRELAARHPEVTAVSVHPGLVDTALYSSVFRESLWGSLGGWWIFRGLEAAMHRGRRLVSVNIEEGARGVLWAALGARGTTKGSVCSGEYYTPVGVAGNGNGWTMNEALARQLWTWMEDELEGKEMLTTSSSAQSQQ